MGVGHHVGHDTVTHGSPPVRSRPRTAAQRVRPMRGGGSLDKAARPTGDGGVPGCRDHPGIGEAEPRRPLWLGQRQVQPTHTGQACGRRLYHELEQGDILSGGRCGLALLASTDILVCSMWAIHRIRQTPIRNTKNFRVLRVRAAIFCSSGINAIGGFHMMGSSRWKGHRILPPIRAQTSRACRPSTRPCLRGCLKSRS